MTILDKVHPPRGVALALALIVMAIGAGCAGAEWRTTYALREAGTLADRTIADVHRAKRLNCIAAGKLPGTPELITCLGDHHKALDTWRLYARPALDSALASTVAGLLIAEKVRAKSDWMDLLKPGACALTRILDAWGHLLPPSVVAALRVPLAAVKGLACPKEVTP